MELLERLFDTSFDAPAGIMELRKLILSLGIQGKLTSSRPATTPIRTVVLKDITSKIGSGSTPAGGKESYATSGIPLIRSMNVHFDGFRENGLAFITQEQADKLSNVVVHEADVLLNITGASIGRVTVAPPEMEGARVNQHVCIIRPCADVIARLGVPIPGGAELTEPVVRITLERPEYAKGKRQFDIEQNDETDRYWKAEGVVKQFLDGLTQCEVRLSERFTISEGYFASDERYVLHLSLERLQTAFGERGALWLFRQFDNLKTLGMLAEISVPLKMKGGAEGNVQFFSDGQFQTIYIYAITELFKESNCLMLLDEPDAFLHPEWQYQFLRQVIQIRENVAPKNHLLMSSHSAITLIPHDREKIRFFDIKNNSVCCFEVSKRFAIEKLSAELIRYSEQEKLLSIFRTIQIKKKPVLFTEGTTDALILNEAWRRIYGDQEIPFIPFYAFSFTYIKQLLTDDRIYAEMGNLPVFSLFDFDEAFNAWNGLKGEVLQQDPFQGLVKKCDGRNAYAIMLPVPQNEAVMKQSIRNRATGKTFGGASCCCIEHLFYGIPETAQYFEDEPCPGGSKVVFKSDGFKTKFAEEIVHTLPNACFKPLKPVFDFIAERCVRRPAARGRGTARRTSREVVGA